MCLGTFSRRGAVASATIYPCAECASSRSIFIVWKRSFLYDKKESCEAGFSACGGSRKRHSSIPLQCDPRGAFLSYGNEVSYTIIKNVPWHILAPRRGCFSNHLPLRRVRILAEHFSRMETKFPIREQKAAADYPAAASAYRLLLENRFRTCSISFCVASAAGT